MFAEHGIIPSMRDTIFSNCKEVIAESGEIVLDSVLEDGVLKSIPIVGTITAICKTGINLRERHFIKETFAFVDAFNNGTITSEKLQAYRQLLEEDPQRAEQELEHIVLLLTSHLNTAQSKRLGAFYRHYVKGSINWSKFIELSEANSRLFEADFDLLKRINEETQVKNPYQAERLLALGLVKRVATTFTEGTLIVHDDLFSLSPFGKTFTQRCTIDE